VKTTKHELERLFSDLLALLHPEAAYLRLLKAVVLDVWKQRQRESERLRTDLERTVHQKRARLDRIEEAFLHERSIDRTTYQRQRDQLREQLALAEEELNDAVINQLDIEGVLAFAEYVFTNPGRFWMELGLEQKQRFQQVMFPDGLRFDGEKFGTAVTCLAFKRLDESASPELSFLRDR
jgi:hypothetical protein